MGNHTAMSFFGFKLQWPVVFIEFGRQIGSIWTFLVGFNPWFALSLFLGASFIMIWRLGALERKGLEGTVLGTLIMPYASGFSNLIFAYIMGRSGQNGKLVLENCLVNNVTNLTLMIGLPALIWGLKIFPEKRSTGFNGGPFKAQRLNRLSLLLTLLAVLFFTGALWALSRDGVLDFGDGIVLVGLFLFWQVFHVFDVIKHNIQRGKSLHWSMAIDAFLVFIAGYAVFSAVDLLVAWIPKSGSGPIVFANLGWLSGILMVLPNGLLAMYYAHARRADIVYSSQIGDGHICIPMCIGLYALFRTMTVPDYLGLGIVTIASAALVHLILIAFLGRLPRIMGLLFTAAYGYFVYQGLIH